MIRSVTGTNKQPTLSYNRICPQKRTLTKGGYHLIEVKNLNKKLVGTISEDEKVYTIIIKGCVTTITANPDGTLNIEQSRLMEQAV